MSRRDAIRNLYMRLFVKSEGYVRYLREKGIVIGEDVTFHSPRQTHVDITAPHLLTIGNHVNLTGPVTILTHDYSWSVIKGVTGEVLGNQKPVSIGNNVFIGWGATILCGTTIADNTIIGAHAVVSGHVEGNSVWGGVPARRICSLEQYREKRKAAQVEEAKSFVRAFRIRWGRYPREEEVPEYFFLFADVDHLNAVQESQVNLMGTREMSLSALRDAREFESFESFLRNC